MISYYGYYAGILMFVGVPNLEFMLFANRAAPSYWEDWWPPFKRVIVDQFLEWIWIAVLAGGIVGAFTGYVYQVLITRRFRMEK